ncbi:MAG: cobalamin-dependent protein [bacterium]
MAPRVLLTSVFKPFAVDDMYSRRKSIHELCHNQLTRAQGVFSPRTYHNTYGIHAIANNIETPTTVLDFPTLKRFTKELEKGYDVIGISAIIPNFQKAKKMVEQAREISPRSTVVIGGFCASVPQIDKLMEVDHICVGDGISFMRELMGLSPEFEFKNPDVYADSRELFGVPLFGVSQNPHIVVGLGCSYGCDFCCVTHFFGRKHIRFYKHGRPLFEEMVRVKERFRTNSIVFIGDDNFLIDLKRAEELRQCVVESGMMFRSFIFASADKVEKFGPEKLAEMGVDTVWIGRESNLENYRKNEGINIPAMVDELKDYGIKTILSSILLLDCHTKDNITDDINDHLSANPALSQFSHYSPAPGTVLYDRLWEENRILAQIPYEEWHAFHQPWFIHPEFTLQEAEKVQDLAYERDFLELGPSIMRFAEVELRGWERMKDSPKPHLRKRAEFFARSMWQYRIICLATMHLAPNQHVRELAGDILGRIETHFGKASGFERATARGLQVTGRLRQWRTRHFGDALQPHTRLVKYNC